MTGPFGSQRVYQFPAHSVRDTDSFLKRMIGGKRSVDILDEMAQSTTASSSTRSFSPSGSPYTSKSSSSSPSSDVIEVREIRYPTVLESPVARRTRARREEVNRLLADPRAMEIHRDMRRFRWELDNPHYNTGPSSTPYRRR